MKQLSLCFIALLLFSCSSKKDNPNPAPSNGKPIQVEVSGLTTLTSVSIQIKKPNGEIVLDIVNQFGNKTYTGSLITERPVKLKAHYSANISSDLDNNGNGSLKFIYDGEARTTAGGNLGGTKGYNVEISIP